MRFDNEENFILTKLFEKQDFKNVIRVMIELCPNSQYQIRITRFLSSLKVMKSNGYAIFEIEPRKTIHCIIVNI